MVFFFFCEKSENQENYKINEKKNYENLKR
jgi:hypothetical protein